MANRFAKKIKSGEIDTEEQLKSEFKALAKELHPDIAGDSFHAEFIRVRQEYESALGDFDRHRFAAKPKDSGTSNKSQKNAKTDLFGELFLLLKRGFPKTVRHEKERLRYQYAVWRFRNAVSTLGGENQARFEAFQRELLAMKTEDEFRFKKIMAILYDLVEHDRKPLSPLRTTIELEYDALRIAEPMGFEAQSFLGRLVAELGDGTIGP